MSEPRDMNDMVEQIIRDCRLAGIADPVAFVKSWLHEVRNPHTRALLLRVAKLARKRMRCT